jgi:hypothetical protein
MHEPSRPAPTGIFASQHLPGQSYDPHWDPK